MTKHVKKRDKIYPMHYSKLKPIDLSLFPYPCPDVSAANPSQHLGDSITHLQLYEPMHATFFDFDPKTTPIGWNHRYHVLSAKEVLDSSQTPWTPVNREVFIKFSPLLDPIKYMVGKYSSAPNAELLKTLPSYASTTDTCHEKILSTANASYIDNFFYYLSSVLKNHHGFIHGMDYYGSYLGIQDRFRMNVEDDLEYLSQSTFFVDNLGKMMILEHPSGKPPPFLHDSSRSARPKISIDDDTTLTLDALNGVTVLTEGEDTEAVEPALADSEMDLVYDNTLVNSESSSSDDSDEDDTEEAESDASWQTMSDEDDEDAPEDEASEDDEDDVSSTDQEAHVFIYDFPVQLIFLEKCAHTFDYLFVIGLSDEEARSALFQIVMILMVYQKMFRFTHNDLHTNNIMYVTTEHEWLYYQHQGKTYRVPTYGRIFKIIDYGRSIYKYQKRIFCSDSFSQDGDASTQYNCEPFLHPSKPRLEPNMSFDLCRLGCSIYDFVFDDNNITKNERSPQTDLQRTIQRWCTDDHGKNVLYKRNGHERYPGFKLYKFIARSVHQHTPEKQLTDPWFRVFEWSGTDQEKERYEAPWMNLDRYPSYV